MAKQWLAGQGSEKAYSRAAVFKSVQNVSPSVWFLVQHSYGLGTNFGLPITHQSDQDACRARGGSPNATACHGGILVLASDGSERPDGMNAGDLVGAAGR